MLVNGKMHLLNGLLEVEKANTDLNVRMSYDAECVSLH